MVSGFLFFSQAIFIRFAFDGKPICFYNASDLPFCLPCRKCVLCRHLQTGQAVEML